MISKTERRKLKRVLKNRYATDVLKVLTENQQFNKNGAPFSRAYISHVFNGLNECEAIENAILKVYEQRKIKVSKKKLRKAEILKK
jgi:hypothetical protein